MRWLLICLLAFPAAAQDVVFDPEMTEQCLGIVAEDEQRSCIGRSASDCMKETEGGESTVGMGGCLEAELTYWDDRLNAEYARLQAETERRDAELAELESTGPRIAPTLREMQRQWIAFRDATCDFERAQWGGGTGGGPATLACLMRLTGEQALYLSTQRLGNE